MPNKAYIELDKELNDFYSSEANKNIYEEICKYYVALTRARYANYLISDEVNERSKSINFISLLSKTIKKDNLNSGVLYESGHKDWFKHFEGNKINPSKNSIKENRPNVDDKLRRKPFTYPQTWSNGSQKELDSRDLFITKN